MRARYYDPASARFLTWDPVPANLSDIQTLDPYLYAADNPISYVDPKGTDNSHVYDGWAKDGDIIDLMTQEGTRLKFEKMDQELKEYEDKKRNEEAIEILLDTSCRIAELGRTKFEHRRRPGIPLHLSGSSEDYGWL